MKKQREPENTGAILCYSNQQYIVIEQQKFRTKIQSANQYLRIDRKAQKIQIVRQLNVKDYEAKSYSAFLGIIDLEGFKYILLCDEAKMVSSIDDLQIFQISSLFFMGYTDEKQLRKRPQKKEICRKIRQYYIILKVGFYFSYKHNLTQPFKNRNKQLLAERYTWNKNLMIQLDKFNIDFKWKCPLIQGFAKSFDVFLEGTKLSYLLITRRSNKKGGTRYFDRGLNEQGLVANFCQTQQIIKLDQFFISDLQIRGSIPIFFEQVGLTTSMKINRGIELAHEVYIRHMNKIIDNYKRVFFMNLLSVNKYGEKLLTEQLEIHIKKELMPNLKYLYYDFHQKVKGGHYEKVDEIIEELRSMKINLRYYVYDSKRDMVIEEPHGVFRTNCLDCLDRTNFFQAKLALITLESILRLFKVCNRDLLSEMKDNNQNDFIKNFRNIWADNGDNISYHYTGTGSTHTDITRDGKRGWLGNFKHKYKTITRFYNQNFWDFYKMKLVALLLGQKSQKEQLSVSNMVKERESQFTTKEMLEIYIFTWKAPKKPPTSMILFPNTPKLIIVSIQDLSEQQKWNVLILDAIDKERYMLVQQKTIYNNMLKVFAQKELIKDISFVEQSKMKFRSYYNTVLSNKSAVFIRFSVNTTKIVVLGCQLEKGRELVQNRVKNLKEIHEKAFQIEYVGKQKSSPILQDDVIFLLGNMNMNVSKQMKDQFGKFGRPDQLQAQHLALIDKFIQQDQSHHVMESLLEYREYEEPEITFAPTYRYVNGTFDPQSSGWPDRIWYSSENKISCCRYGAVQQMRQEHVPVFGSYLVQIQKINADAKQKIVHQIIDSQSIKLGLNMQEQQAQQMNIQL